MLPLGGGVYSRWVFKREERLYKKSILGGSLIGEGRLKEREGVYWRKYGKEFPRGALSRGCSEKLLKIYKQIQEAVIQRCSVIRCSETFCKIHRKTSFLESLF